MAASVSFDEYLASLSKLSVDVDPTAETAHTVEIKDVAMQLAEIGSLDRDTLTSWVLFHPDQTYVLGLVLGMSQERLRNTLARMFGTTSVKKLAREKPVELVAQLDDEFGLVAMLEKQLDITYTYGDILVARSGGRTRAMEATSSGRRVEDEIEAVVAGLGLEYQTRTRFVGKGRAQAPCDLVVPHGDNPLIAVAAKGFDSTGSKLSDAVREVAQMAEVRLSRQFVCAVVDGMAWTSRQSDLREMYRMWENDEIDGLYTLNSLDRFRDDIAAAAAIRGLL